MNLPQATVGLWGMRVPDKPPPRPLLLLLIFGLFLAVFVGFVRGIPGVAEAPRSILSPGPESLLFLLLLPVSAGQRGKNECVNGEAEDCEECQLFQQR